MCLQVDLMCCTFVNNEKLTSRHITSTQGQKQNSLAEQIFIYSSFRVIENATDADVCESDRLSFQRPTCHF